MSLAALPTLVAAFALAQPADTPRSLVKAAPAKTEEEKLAITGLPPAKYVQNLCLLRYRVSTNSPECQAYFDQGLGFYYSYVWMEAARSFETALKYDPKCAMAWWGLSRACEKWGRGDQIAAVKKAKELMPSADAREQKLILARLQEKGLTDEKITPDQRQPAAVKTIDELLTLYDDDQEAWYYRAQLAGGAGLFGGQASAVPFYKALLRINPLHPGANHELVHFYENARRPALGFPYAEKYIESSPGIPHPFHMQAHLATRLGRWDKTADRSARAIELEREYHKFQNVKATDDHQFTHHLEILTISLVHDGRYQEARKIKAEAQKAGYSHWLPWFRLHLGERDWKEVQTVIENYRKRDKTTAAYLSALAALAQGDLARASAEVDTLRQAVASNRRNSKVEQELWEVQGLLQCKTGSPDEGLKLLQRVVDKTKNDFGHHAWGNGAYFMEAWGLAALESGRYAIAEEGLLEALAHDPGSVRAALGLEALCRRQGRAEEANRYAALAKKFWRKADIEAFGNLKDEVTRMCPANPQISSPGDPGISPKTDTKTGGAQ